MNAFDLDTNTISHGPDVTVILQGGKQNSGPVFGSGEYDLYPVINYSLILTLKRIG